MEHIFKIALILVLLVIGWQDFKYRAVWWILFPMAWAFQISISLANQSSEMVLKYFFINLSFILLQGIILWIYVYVTSRNKPLAALKLLDKSIGLGDWFFFIVLAAAFSILNFVIIHVIFLLLALLFSVINPMKSKAIPLAGIMAWSYIPIVISGIAFIDINPYIDILNFGP